VTRSGDCNLEVAAAYERGIVEGAKLRDVHDVAENATTLGFVEDVPVQVSRLRSHHDEEDSVKVVIRESAQREVDPSRVCPSANGFRRVKCNNMHPCTGVEERTNLLFS
jgi:hypothetical protein